jgi:hypothetical protein
MCVLHAAAIKQLKVEGLRGFLRRLICALVDSQLDPGFIIEQERKTAKGDL